MNAKKIVLLTPWYTKNMGYNNVLFPKSIAKLGVEMHIVTSRAQCYYNLPDYDEIYGKFHGEGIQPEGTEKLDDNLYLHRLEFKSFKTEIYFKGLRKKLKELNPDYIQTFDCNSINTFKLAFMKPFLGYKLFTGNSIVLSIFPMDKEWDNYSNLKKLDWYLKHVLPGKFISWMSNRIYPSTIDAEYIATKYFGASKAKSEVSPLGVDTDLFYPNRDSKSKDIRAELGIGEEFVAIYTGRFTNGKNPLILAKAIQELRKNGCKVKGLFLGQGEQNDQIGQIDGCIVLGFKGYEELPYYYNSADIGVWPTQESTSMLDAASCGLPIVVSDRLKAVERVQGNGLQYKEGDHLDLADQIEKLIKDKKLYKELSDQGIQKMKERFSWDSIAKKKLEAYQKF